jgi:hypothetical protein
MWRVHEPGEAFLTHVMTHMELGREEKGILGNSIKALAQHNNHPCGA